MENIHNDFNSVDEYIAAFPGKIQERLKELRATILECAPEAEERISYGMPAYTFKGILVYFAGFKNHIGFYPLPRGILEFEQELSPYKSGKGSVRFPLDQPLPLELVKKIVKFRVAENINKVEMKSNKRRK